MKYTIALFVLLLGTTSASPPERAYITSVWMSQTDARGGDVVHGRVGTSKATASIEVRVGGYGTSLQNVASRSEVRPLH